MLSQIQFYYRFGGNKNKPTILFLHGFMGSGNDWHDVVKYLSPHYHCLTIDLPGHGKTECKRDISFEETAHALIEFVNQQRINQCFLTGYSMGGRLALFLTMRYPQFFNKVALESASPGLRTEKEKRKRIAHDDKIAEELESGDFHLFLRNWYNQALFRGLAGHKKIDQLLTVRMKNDPKRLARALRFLGTGKQPSLWKELGRNCVPILLLVGEDDIKFRSIARQMHELNSFIQVVAIEKCSHNIHLQQPEQFAHYLHRFFQNRN